MKIIQYIISIAGLALVLSCSKDLGNYTYKDVNAISIEGLLDGGHHTARIYTVSFSDTLKLHPTITGTLSKTDTSHLSFEWRIDGKKVSTYSKIAYPANEKYGKLQGEFYVYDHSTDIRNSYLFFIDVVNPYKLGYYILSRKDNGDAVLYCKSFLKENSTFENVIIPELNPLGSNPISISSTRKYGASSSDYYNQIILGIRNATYPVAILDSREFQPSLFYNQTSYVGDDNFVFDPVKLSVSPVLSDLVIFATNSDGKIYSLWKGAISQQHFSDDPLDYQVDPTGLANPYSLIQQMTSFYDNKNKRIRLFARSVITPKTYFFERSLDQQTKGIHLTDGQDYIIGAEASGIDTARYVYLTKFANTLYSYKLGTSSTLSSSELTKIAEKEIPNIDQLGFASYDLSGRFWYISIGNTIYRASVLGLDLQPYVTLPADAAGSINKFHIAQNQLLISTYDANEKSSIYIYDNTNLRLLYSEKGLEKVVDLIVGI